MYAGMDVLFPQAFAELLHHFETMASDELLSRCSRQRTTNMNESMHQKVALMMHKCKSHSTLRLDFGVGNLMMSQNVGHEKASLLNVLGVVGEDISKYLKFKDHRSFLSASRKHKLEEGTTHQHRRKVNERFVREGRNRGGNRDEDVNVVAGGSGIGTVGPTVPIPEPPGVSEGDNGSVVATEVNVGASGVNEGNSDSAYPGRGGGD